jgi:hypothetical protein
VRKITEENFAGKTGTGWFFGLVKGDVRSGIYCMAKAELTAATRQRAIMRV